MAQLVHRALHELLAEAFVAHVAGVRAAATPFLLDQPPGLRGVLVLVEVGNRDVGALAGVGDGHGPTDAAVPARDERYLALQFAAAAMRGIVGARARRHLGFDARLAILVLRRLLLARFLWHWLLLSARGASAGCIGAGRKAYANQSPQAM